MRHRLLKTGAMLGIATLAACDGGGTDTRTFALEHMSPQSAQSLVLPYVPAGSASVRVSISPPALTVAASADRLDQIEEMLQRLDVAAPDVRLRFQLIEADGFTDVDPAIADVEAVLRDLFRFGGYRLAAEALVATTPGSKSLQRLLGVGSMPLTLEVYVDRISGAAAGGFSVDVSVLLRGPDGEILSTRVIVPAGQTVVLGTARPFEDRGALILVVRPEIQ